MLCKFCASCRSLKACVPVMHDCGACPANASAVTAAIPRLYTGDFYLKGGYHKCAVSPEPRVRSHAANRHIFTPTARPPSSHQAAKDAKGCRRLVAAACPCSWPSPHRMLLGGLASSLGVGVQAAGEKRHRKQTQRLS